MIITLLLPYRLIIILECIASKAASNNSNFSEHTHSNIATKKQGLSKNQKPRIRPSSRWRPIVSLSEREEWETSLTLAIRKNSKPTFSKKYSSFICKPLKIWSLSFGSILDKASVILDYCSSKMPISTLEVLLNPFRSLRISRMRSSLPNYHEIAEAIGREIAHKRKNQFQLCISWWSFQKGTFLVVSAQRGCNWLGSRPRINTKKWGEVWKRTN